jgi:hypothetical protein
MQLSKIHKVVNEADFKDLAIKMVLNHKKLDSGCWEWQKGFDGKGYAAVTIKRKSYLAHRVMYICYGGIIPAGINLCHKCDNPKCINPLHMFLGTQKDNVLDQVKKLRHRNNRKTQCVRGHKFTTGNTYVYASGARRCRECSRKHDLKRRSKKD